MKYKNGPRGVWIAIEEATVAVYRLMGERLPLGPLLLYCLASRAEPPTVSECATEARVGLKNASRILKSMTKRGLIKLEGDTEDTRKKRIVLTDQGKRVLVLVNREILAASLRVLEQHIKGHS